MDHASIELIYMSWDQIKVIPHYKEEFGNLMFSRIRYLSPRLGARFQTLLPAAGDQEGAYAPSISSDEMSNGGNNISHIKMFAAMLDLLIHLLGPDMDGFDEQSWKLGVRHAQYGTKSMDYPVFGEALIHTLENTLGASYFTEKVEEAWRDMWRRVSLTMIRAARSLKASNNNEKASDETNSNSDATVAHEDEASPEKPTGSSSCSRPGSRRSKDMALLKKSTSFRRVHRTRRGKQTDEGEDATSSSPKSSSPKSVEEKRTRSMSRGRKSRLTRMLQKKVFRNTTEDTREEEASATTTSSSIGGTDPPSQPKLRGRPRRGKRLPGSTKRSLSPAKANILDPTHVSLHSSMSSFYFEDSFLLKSQSRLLVEKLPLSLEPDVPKTTVSSASLYNRRRNRQCSTPKDHVFGQGSVAATNPEPQKEEAPQKRPQTTRSPRHVPPQQSQSCDLVHRGVRRTVQPSL